MNTKLSKMAEELLSIEKDLSDRGALPNEIEVYTFEQTWPSTALGFGGIGGQAITSANTYVIFVYSEKLTCYVYFAGGFAYSVPYSYKILNDIQNRNIAPVRSRGKYICSANDFAPAD